jgi:hypothetical protein
VRVFEAPRPAAAAVDSRAEASRDVFLETGPIDECDGDDGNIFGFKPSGLNHVYQLTSTMSTTAERDQTRSKAD